jgi:hypothetical protein
MYAKAKSEPSWRFWGLFVHVCKRETLHEAYRLAKRKGGAPGVDGVTFAAIEAGGVGEFLEQIRAELVSREYVPPRNRRKEIPKDGGKKVRVLGIPSIRDRVVQGALLLILEPIFEAGFQSGSYDYRPGRTAHEAVERVAQAIRQGKTRVIDLDLKAYFDNVRPHILLKKVAGRGAETGRQAPRRPPTLPSRCWAARHILQDQGWPSRPALSVRDPAPGGQVAAATSARAPKPTSRAVGGMKPMKRIWSPAAARGHAAAMTRIGRATSLCRTASTPTINPRSVRSTEKTSHSAGITWPITPGKSAARRETEPYPVL